MMYICMNPLYICMNPLGCGGRPTIGFRCKQQGCRRVWCALSWQHTALNYLSAFFWSFNTVHYLYTFIEQARVRTRTSARCDPTSTEGWAAPYVVEDADKGGGEVGVEVLAEHSIAVPELEVVPELGVLQDPLRILLQLGVVAADDPALQELVHRAVLLGVKVSGQHEGQLAGDCELLELLDQRHHLPHLYVGEALVLKDVRGSDADPPHVPCRLPVDEDLQHQHQRHVALEQALQRLLAQAALLSSDSSCPRDGDVVELQRVLLDQREPRLAEEDGTPVHLPVLPHALSRLLLVHPLVPRTVELGLQELLPVIGLHFLESEDVGLVAQDLSQQVPLPVVPCEGPGRRVRVDLGRRVDVRQAVVSEHLEGCLGRARVETVGRLGDLDHAPGRRDRRGLHDFCGLYAD
eukprot:768424-Hanusia_phi.AAC.7